MSPLGQYPDDESDFVAALRDTFRWLCWRAELHMKQIGGEDNRTEARAHYLRDLVEATAGRAEAKGACLRRIVLRTDGPWRWHISQYDQLVVWLWQAVKALDLPMDDVDKAMYIAVGQLYQAMDRAKLCIARLRDSGETRRDLH